MKRYVIAVLVLFFIMAMGIVVLAKLGSNSSDKPEQKAAVQERQLNDYAGSTSAKVVMTTQGAIVGNDVFRSIRITVTRDQRTIEILDGYTNEVQSSKTFANNQAAFEAFLWALRNAGYMNTRTVKVTDDRGVCPQGLRYSYELWDNDEQLHRSWSTSCTTKDGTFGGASATVQRLFQNQITDYSDIISGVRLR